MLMFFFVAAFRLFLYSVSFCIIVFVKTVHNVEITVEINMLISSSWIFLGVSNNLLCLYFL